MERTREGTTRRGFLSSMAAIPLGTGGRAGATGAGTRRTSVDVGALTLDGADLLAPDPDAYVELPVAFDGSSLGRHLRDAAAGFEPGARAAIGFVAPRDHDEVPLTVESAVIDANGPAGARLLDGELADWIRATRVGSDRVERIAVQGDPDGTNWTVMTVDGWREVVRLQRIGPDFLGVTSVYGDGEATLNPETALDYYARVVRTRAVSR